MFEKIHGFDGTRVYRIWKQMKYRCTNKNCDSYELYGGRGITVCNEWLNSAELFCKWALESGYKDDLSIDRIDNNKGYSPDNCRWVTCKTQNRNRRNNHLLTLDGKTQCITDWAEELGISISCIERRLRIGLPIEFVLSKEKNRRLKEKINGRKATERF